MKFNNIFLPLVAAAAFLTVACTDEVEYTPTSPTDNDEVYFPNTQPTEIALAQNATEFTVTLERLKADNAITVALEGSAVDGDDVSAAEVFTIPSSIQFAEGVKSVEIPVAIDFGKLVADVVYTVALTATGDQLSPYGDSSISVAVSYAPWSEWEQISADPVSGSLGNPWSGEPIDRFAFYRYSLINSNLEQYIIEGPTYSNLYFDFELNIDKTQTYDIDGTTCYKVTMPLTDTHFDNGDDRIMYIDAFTWMRNYGAENGPNLSDEQIERIMANNGFGQSYYNPATGQFRLWLVPCVKGQELRRYTQSYTVINLPGYKQYSVVFSYAGNFVDPDGIESAIISVLKSDDVTSYVYDILPGNLTGDNLAQAIEALKDNGDAISVEETNYTIVYQPDAPGVYTAIAVGYDGEEAVCESSFAFEFDSVQKESDWTSIGYAEYTDDFLTGALQNWSENFTWDVEVEESKTTPGLFRLVNPYAALAESMPNTGLHQMSGKYYMVIDASVPDEVYIDLSVVGLDFDDDDSMICYSLAANLLAGGNSREEIKAAGYFGTLEDGVITFPARTLLVSWSSILPNLGYANTNGAFCLDLNSTSIMAKPAKFAKSKSGMVHKAKTSAVKGNVANRKAYKPSSSEIANYKFRFVDNTGF